MTGKWALDRSVSIGHIISTITLLALLAASWSQMTTKVETQTVRVNALESRMDREAQRQREDMAQIRESLNRIEDRLERIAEN